jgi:exodeoxyribonuclease-3
MRIITVNVNGIRSAARKGFFAWLKRQRADIVCLQEIKADTADLPPEILAPRGWHAFFHSAKKKGYSGVAIYTRKAPDHVVVGTGVRKIDDEGRYLQVDFGPLSVVSLYLPSGSSSEAAQAKKFDFLARFHPQLKKHGKSGREFIVCGDWNIAHKEIDLKNWRANQKNSGFLPEEREWLTGVLDKLGWVDVFRTLNPLPEQYTWWSSRGQAWAKNVGWRIDYQLATPAISRAAQYTRIYKDERFSDHAPLIVDYDYKL